MKRPTSPQQKKVLSYSRDRRNLAAKSFSTSGAAARFSVALRKKKANRALRKAERVSLATTIAKNIEAEPFVARTGRRSWRKISDSPLAEKVAKRGSASALKSSLRASGARKAKSKRLVPKTWPYDVRRYNEC
jgi:hypothetical protein